ncbi:hypothetical protein WJX84_001986 [Apatococcus fuscideae]|uniref:CCHC-type domain-containing protein n=1 Tax=Apatococcus fuscideae TaxID=2026836 RepID=A0AAW1RHD6_9CHLO
MEEVRKVSVPKLDVDNYDTWAITMELALETKGLWEYVLKDLPDDADDATKSKDRKARAEIGLCLEIHHLPALRIHKTAKSLWDALEKVYQEKNQARQLVLNAQLINLKKGLDEPLIKYVARAKHIRDQLIAAGAEPNKPLLTLSVLRGLPAEYEIVKTQMQTSNQELTLESIESKLNIVEQNIASEEQTPRTEKALLSGSRQPQQSAGKQAPRESRKCHYCGNKGHLQKDCRKKLRDQRHAGSSQNQQGQRQPQAFRALAAMVTSNGDSWIIDSGADRHITGDISKMMNIRPCSGKDAVTIEWGDGHAVAAESVGDVMLHGVKDADLPIKLRNVLFVPTAKHNLFSLREAARAGAEWNYDGKAFRITKDGELWATAKASERARLWFLQPLSCIQSSGHTTPMAQALRPSQL